MEAILPVRRPGPGVWGRQCDALIQPVGDEWIQVCPHEKSFPVAIVQQPPSKCDLSPISIATTSQGKLLTASGVSREEGPTQTPPCLQPEAWKPLFPRTCAQGKETRAGIRNTPSVLRWVGFADPHPGATLGAQGIGRPDVPCSLLPGQAAADWGVPAGASGPVEATWWAREMTSRRDSCEGLPWTRARPGVGGGG